MNAELLLDLIDRSPTPFHAVATAKDLLTQAGYAPVPTDGTPYGAGLWYAERNGSALIAFRIPENINPATVSFRISAAHGDSPCFRLKPNHQLQGTYSRLNTEVYGGSIYHT
ncbi:MAG: M18 family aminopeptidase, partial [Clostridia bacterium]|nr:M18 family aminopeptidase [Clostridia bacterium]